jgi:hypothetical protein
MATWPHAGIQAELRTTLDGQLRALNARPSVTNPARIYASHVTLAAASRLDDLLGKWALDSTIKQIDALAALGCRGVMLQISAPILDSTVPNALGYRSFYAGVVAAIRARGLKLLIETPLVFSKGSLGGSFDYSPYTSTSALLTAVHRHVRYCAEAFDPDWLVVAQEPGTGATQAGKEITAQQWIKYVTNVVAAIDGSPAVNRNITKLAAGVGAWEDEEYVRAYAALPTLDAVDFHFYPIASTTKDYVERLRTFADIAKGAGKRVTLSECGFYPHSKAEGSKLYQHSSQVFLRDCYAPFTPERLLFMRVMGAFLRTHDTAFGAWFYTRQLFGDGVLPYDDETDGYSYPRAESLLNREAVDGWTANPRVISQTGQQWRALMV